jgi:uncharacterized protein (TIGR03790 family)
MMGKSEIRNPKSEGNPNSDIRRKPRSEAGFGLRDSEFFRISDFGFRICHSISLLCVLLVPLSLPALAVDDVVVIYNRKVPESKQVADYYAQRRQVPSDQVIGLDLPAGESITRGEYNEQLREPLLKALTDRKLLVLAEGAAATNHLPVAAKIRYAALCYGVPLKIKHDPRLNEPAALKLPEGLRRNDAAVDSELACLPGSLTNYLLAGALGNPFYGATNAAVMHPTNGLLLVARLDGPTPEIARGLVDKAMEAETNGLWGRAYVDIRSTTNVDYQIGDRWLATAAEMVWRMGYDTLMETNEHTFRASFPLSQIAIYAGWYDADVSGPFTRAKVEFMPGAFAYHLHSYSAQSIRDPNRHWVGPLLAKGATITLGCVEEPYLSGTPNIPTFLAGLLGRGFSFGEAAWAAQGSLSWQTTVVGDPLYRPVNQRPEALHAELQRRGSPLIEWSHAKVVNLNLSTGLSREALIAYLEREPTTRHSAVLTEKLADFYWLTKKYSDALDTTETALKRGPSPQQKVRLLLTLNDRLRELGRDEKRFACLERFIQECPDYPDLPDIRKQLAELGQKLGKQ